MIHDSRAMDGQVNVYYGYLAKSFCECVHHLKTEGICSWGEAEWVILSHVFFDAMKKRLPISTVRPILIQTLSSFNIGQSMSLQFLGAIFESVEKEYNEALKKAGISHEKSTWSSFLTTQSALKPILFPARIQFPQSDALSKFKSDVIKALSKPLETSNVLSHLVDLKLDP